MARQTKIKVDISDLQDAVKALGKGHYARIGILGGDASAKHKEAVTKVTKKGKVSRKAGAVESPFTNAEIGLVHEMGSISRNIPARSFLRMPIFEKKRDLIRFLGTTKIQKLFEAGQIKKIFKMIGIEAEGIVDDAFRSRGFGKWALLSQRTIDAKGSDAPLIDTAQLRRAVSSDVVTR